MMSGGDMDGSWRVSRLGFLPAPLGLPSYLGIRAGRAPCGSRSGRHSMRLSPCARSVPHPHRCWHWWRSWSAWGLRGLSLSLGFRSPPSRSSPAPHPPTSSHRCCSPPRQSRRRSHRTCCSAARRRGSAGSGTETPSCLCSGGSGPWAALGEGGASGPELFTTLPLLPTGTLQSAMGRGGHKPGC